MLTNVCVIWLTGLPCSGKTTIATMLLEKFYMHNIEAVHLDGDIVRIEKNNFDFSPEGRKQNIFYTVSMAKKIIMNGQFVIASLVSPFKYHREYARKNLSNFVEVFVDCPISICKTRDYKGLYRKAENGLIKNFTGISDKYECPKNFDIHLMTNLMPAEECVGKIFSYLYGG